MFPLLAANAHSAITFDIDWAPDWAIGACAGLCARAGVPATFFVTHHSPVLADLRREPGRFELGIHPNFLQGSDHGAEPRRVLSHCLEIVPEAVCMRTHGLVQSSLLLTLVATASPILVDLSLLLLFHPDLQPTTLHLGSPSRRLIRLPYFWEDDLVASWPGWDWSLPPHPFPDRGLHIYDFHPIHVALNTADLESYEALKAAFRGRPLASLTEAECAPFRNHGQGTRTYLEALLAAPGIAFATAGQLAGPLQVVEP